MIALRCWKATVVAGSSWRLATSSLASRPRRISSVPARNDGAASAVAASDADELLEDGRLRAVPERDQGPAEQRAIGCRRPPSG